MTSSALDDSELTALTDVTEQILDAHLDPTAAGLEVAFNAELWAALEGAGLTLLSVPESAGGAGAGISASAIVLAAAAAAAAPLPIAETDMLAGWLLASAGLGVPPGPLTAAAGTLKVDETPSGTTVSGRLERVPWGRDVAAVAALAVHENDATVVVVPRGEFEVVPGANIAREPRDTLVLKNARVTETAAAPTTAVVEFDRRGALARAVQLAGAAQRAVEMTVRYVGEREQFGKPLARLQAVQQQLAEAAAEAAAAHAAVDAALSIVERDGAATRRAEFAVAVAKARSSAAAGLIARTTHQLHGALGFTLEHPLRLVTTRLWAWSSEFGDQVRWDTVVGEAVLGSDDDMWRTVTALS